ncbi:hypothetical protein BH10ACT3_BH10ACT3_08100 [soil metagenome]
MKRTRLAVLLVAGLVLVGGACSGGDYSKADFQTDLEEQADVSPEVAKCVADGVEDAGIDISKLDSEGDFDDVMNDADQKKFTDATTKCIMDDAGIDPSDTSIPD